MTSWGTGCGDAGRPGVYARLGAPALRAFATDPDPTWSPVNVTAPTMPASATVGDVVTCTPGTWTGDDLTFTYEFHRARAPRRDDPASRPARRTRTPSPPPTPRGSPASSSRATRAARLGAVLDLGRRAGVRDAGDARRRARLADPVARRRRACPPTTASRARSSAPRRDALAARGDARARCASRRCTVSVRVTDPAPSSGIRRVDRHRALEAALPQERAPHDVHADRRSPREGHRHHVDAAHPRLPQRHGVDRDRRPSTSRAAIGTAARR